MIPPLHELDLGPELGRGRSGVVHRTTLHGREAVVKIPHRVDEHERRRLRGELEEARRLPEGIRRDLGVTAPDPSGRFGLVSAYLPGRDLGTVLRSVDLGVPERLHSLLYAMEQLGRLLGGLHAAGAAHGNLVPGNVLLGEADRRGRVLLLDLSWSRAGLSAPPSEARPPEFDGTARPASDQWAYAGLILHALDRAGLSARAKLPTDLHRGLARARSASVADRFPRVDHLADLLADALEVANGARAADPSGPTTAGSAPVRATGDISMDIDPSADRTRLAPDPTHVYEPPPPPRSHRGLALGAVLLAGLGLALAAQLRGKSSPDGLPPDALAAAEPPPSAAAPASEVAPPPSEVVAPPPPSAPVESASETPSPKPSPGVRCEPGQPASCLEAGRQALAAKRPKRARRLFERGCDAGHGASCAELAELWAEGWGGPARAATAQALRERACRLDFRPACER